MLRRIRVDYSGNKINLYVRNTGYISRFLGLMFKTRKTGNLLFEFKEDVNISIHSLFVFFTFLIVWLDDENRILGYRIVRPFCFSVLPKKPFRKFVEIPISLHNKRLINFFVGKRKNLNIRYCII